MMVEIVVGGAFATGIGWFLVRFLARLVWAFKDTIDRHLVESTRVMTDVEDALKMNTFMVHELRDVVREHLNCGKGK